ncbi:MAG: WYL domain-containing protein, partial [Pyrinomonadaceae bacterium]
VLEIIRFAAANHLCVDLSYDHGLRRIEPYSLRQTAEGNFLLHAIRSDSGEHRSYRVDRMQRALVTAQTFSPRYLVELTPSDPLSIRPAASRPRVKRTASLGPRASRNSRRPKAFRSGNPIYVYRCTVCGKTFKRKLMDGSLNPHKHPRGYECPGRVGVYVRTNF